MSAASEAILKIQTQIRLQSDVQLKLLALLLSKPLEFHPAIPAGWDRCRWVAIETEKEWPDPERELMPVINVLVSNLAHDVLTPVDICVVRRKSPGSIAIVVKYE